MTPSHAQYIEAARNLYVKGSDDDIIITDAPKVAPGESGAFVACWVWVTKEEANEIPKPKRLLKPTTDGSAIGCTIKPAKGPL